MIYLIRFLLYLLLGLIRGGYAFTAGSQKHWIKTYYRKCAPTESIPEGNTVTVRFVNTISGEDVVVRDVQQGQNLMFLGDSAGVKIPRACRTGLCGTCTCEVITPGSIPTHPTEREGFTMIRACSAQCYAPEGMDEMVVDVGRMKTMRRKKPPTSVATTAQNATTTSDTSRDNSADSDTYVSVQFNSAC